MDYTSNTPESSTRPLLSEPDMEDEHEATSSRQNDQPHHLDVDDEKESVEQRVADNDNVDVTESETSTTQAISRPISVPLHTQLTATSESVSDELTIQQQTAMMIGTSPDSTSIGSAYGSLRRQYSMPSPSTTMGVRGVDSSTTDDSAFERFDTLVRARELMDPTAEYDLSEHNDGISPLPGRQQQLRQRSLDNWQREDAVTTTTTTAAAATTTAAAATSTPPQQQPRQTATEPRTPVDPNALAMSIKQRRHERASLVQDRMAGRVRLSTPAVYAGNNVDTTSDEKFRYGGPAPRAATATLGVDSVTGSYPLNVRPVRTRAPGRSGEIRVHVAHISNGPGVYRDDCPLVVLPSALLQFFDIAKTTLCLKTTPVMLWNEVGLPVRGLEELIDGEVVYVGDECDTVVPSSETYGKFQYVRRMSTTDDSLPARAAHGRGGELVVPAATSDLSCFQRASLCCWRTCGSCCKLSRPSWLPRLRHGPSTEEAATVARARYDRFWADPDFDISFKHLRTLFDAFDVEQRGHISYEQFRDGLRSLKLDVSDADFNMLTRKVDVDRSGDILRQEFIHSIQGLVLQNRLQGTLDGYDMNRGIEEMFCYDFSPQQYRFRCTPKSQHSRSLDEEKFVLEPKGAPDGYNVRWISLAGRSPQVLTQIGDKYGLHSLEVEDAMELYERPRVVRHRDGHMQLILRVIRAKKKLPLTLVDEQLTMFLVDDTVITVQDKANNYVTFPILQRLPYAGSKLRLGSSEFLVYSIIDQIVDHALVLLRRLNQELAELERIVYTPSRTPPEIMVNIHRISRQVNLMQGWVGPTQAVLNKLVYAVQDEDIVEYYLDVLDHSHEVAEQVTHMLSWCQSLNELSRANQSHNMEKVMYTLTLITSILMPAQFLTGVYGMNWAHFPELDLEYGYLYFWLTTIAIMVTMIMWFRRQQWI
jgi:magnesium/cobalt transport protein CorA